MAKSDGGVLLALCVALAACARGEAKLAPAAAAPSAGETARAAPSVRSAAGSGGQATSTAGSFEGSGGESGGEPSSAGKTGGAAAAGGTGSFDPLAGADSGVDDSPDVATNGEAGSQRGGAGMTSEAAGSAGASGMSGQPAPAGAGVAGRTSAPGRCRIPRTCEPIDTLPFALAPCCYGASECGYELIRPPELRDILIEMSMDGTANPDVQGTCMPAQKIFISEPGQEEQRIPVEGGRDQLITPACESRVLLAFPLIGCCMPNNQCGISTYQISGILSSLTLFPAPFKSIECLSATQLNTQFRAAGLGGLAQIPATTGTCNYADLNARLPASDAPAQ